MTFAISETRSGETRPRLRPSWFQELNNREFLTMLNRELRLLLEGKLESFHSDVDSNTAVMELFVEGDFWKAPLFYVEIKTKIATENDTRVSEEPEEKLLSFQKILRRRSMTPPISEDMLDWDAHIETPPPPRSSGAIKARFRYAGPRKPIPLDDPYS